jgi:hypothetical protein
VTPRRILAIGWLGLVLYAYPGFMSYDSVLQLLQARDHVYTGGHPPMMGVLWGVCDALIAGPLLMLLLQVTCFVTGLYLVLSRALAPRPAAIATVAITWFPPVAAVLAVIWKDSQMAAYLMLGTGLLLSPGRRLRLAGLGALFLATSMRYNALAITLPIVALLFVWDDSASRLKRYGIALAAWLAITLGANALNGALTSGTGSLWHDSLALYDITGTLRYAPDLSDEELRKHLAGTNVIPTSGFQALARGTQSPDDLPPDRLNTFGSGVYVPALWVTTNHLFRIPSEPSQHAAIARAWAAIVPTHLAAYLRYRWEVTKERLHLSGEVPSATYVWFGDVINIEASMAKTEHHAVPSKLQVQLHRGMLALGTSWLFRPWIYLVLLVIAAAVVRTRLMLAIAIAGLANEAALFVLAPTIDYRYSVWLVVAAGVCTAVAVTRFVRSAAARPTP